MNNSVLHFPSLVNNPPPPPPPPSPPVVYDDARALVTVITNEHGQPFGKVAWIDEHGTFRHKTEAHVTSGDFNTLHVSRIDDLVFHLTGGHFTSSSALVYGVCRELRGKIGTKNNARGIARTNENFPRRKGKPGVLNFDFDDQPDRDIRIPGMTDLDALLSARVAWWGTVRRVYLPSASAGIRLADGSPASIKRGLRCLMLIDDSSKARELGQQVVAALYEAGCGRVVVNVGSKSVSRLWRCWADDSVWDDSKPDFGFGARLMSASLSQIREPVYFDGAAMLRTADVPGGGSLKAFKVSPAGRAMFAAAEAEFQAKRAEMRGQFVAAETQRLGITPQMAGRIYDLANAEKPELLDDWVITLDNGEQVTCGQIYADPKAYDGRLCLDPVEPEYDNSRAVAKIHSGKRQRQRFTITSMAHGGDGAGGPKTYLLRRYTPQELAYRLFGAPTVPSAPVVGVATPAQPSAPAMLGVPTVAPAQPGGHVMPGAGVSASVELAREAYVAAKHEAVASGRHTDMTFDIEPLITMLAACEFKDCAAKLELESMKEWGRYGISVLTKQYKAECNALRRAKAAERRTQAAELAARYAADDTSLEISRDLPFAVNLDRFHRRYVLLKEGGKGIRFADLARIGQQEFISDRTTIELEYSNIVASDDSDKVITLVAAYLRSTSDLRRVASHRIFNPQATPGFGYDNGVGVINGHLPPVHPLAGGDTAVVHWFLRHLVPDDREREYLLSWLACKLQQPWIVGHSVIMVADHEGEEKQGTGRGTLTRIIELLFGEAYVAKKSIADLNGRRGNGWNDWLKSRLWLVIAELRADGGEHRYADRKALYNEMKELLDPGETRKGIQQRGVTAYEANIYVTGLLATNYPDAMLISKGDRRFSVLANGGIMSMQMRDAIRAWMAEPLNIGAFYRELRARQWWVNYDPHGLPLVTDAKSRMIELSETGGDEMVSAFRDFTQEQGIEIVTDDLIAKWAVAEYGTADAVRVRAAFRTMLHRLPRDRSRVRTAHFGPAGRPRVKALRNVNQWRAAPQETIRDAYLYAERIINALAFPGAPQLTVVPQQAQR